MVRKQSPMGMSARPERINARRLLVAFLAVNIRCTMSWSVPWVAMVMKVEPKMAAQMVYSVPNTVRTLSRKGAPGLVPESKKIMSLGP